MRDIYLGKTLILDAFVGKHRANFPTFENIVVDYVFTAGGGGGGAAGGGGGGGEVQTNYFEGAGITLNNRDTYFINIGAGGVGGEFDTTGYGVNGEDTFISASNGDILIKAFGGGGGGGLLGGYGTGLTYTYADGRTGGSGGGGTQIGNTGGATTGSGYGNDGGDCSDKFVATPTCSPSTGSATPSLPGRNNTGGGGGALPANWSLPSSLGTITDSDGRIWYDCPPGSEGQWPIGGPGGEPFIIPWVKTATSEVGAGGGGAFTWSEPAGPSIPYPTLGYPDITNTNGGGTTGGSGARREDDGDVAGGSNAIANSGAGGGGGGLINTGTSPSNYWRVYQGGNGSSGVAVIRYPIPQRFEGGSVEIEDGYVYHTFTSSSVLTYKLV